MSTTREKLLSLNVVNHDLPSNKVSVVGVGKPNLFLFCASTTTQNQQSTQNGIKNVSGQVGMACAFSMLVQVSNIYDIYYRSRCHSSHRYFNLFFIYILQGTCNELALTDVAADKLKGELMDLRQGLAFIKNVKINASTDLSVTANSKIIVISAGVRQKPGERYTMLISFTHTFIIE